MQNVFDYSIKIDVGLMEYYWRPLIAKYELSPIYKVTTANREQMIYVRGYVHWNVGLGSVFEWDWQSVGKFDIQTLSYL